MRIKGILLFVLFSITFIPASSQDLLGDAFEQFAGPRLWEFEEIPVEWKMKGVLQADLNEGLNNLRENNLKMAEENLTVVINSDPTIWQAYYYRSAVRKKLNTLLSARRDIEKALKLHGEFYEGLLEQAKILYLAGSTAESEKAINKAIRLDNSRGTGHYLRGDINLSQGQKAIAINSYEACIAVDKLFHDARIKLALISALDGKDEAAALPKLQEVLSYDSLHKSALLFRSIILHKKNKAQSIKDLSNVIRLSPDNIFAIYTRGVYSYENADYNRAFSDFHKVIQMTAKSDNDFAGKQSWLDKKIDVQNAGAYVVTRVYGLPEDDAMHIKTAYCHLIANEYDLSITKLRQVYVLREPVTAYLMAVAHEHKGDHVNAYKYYTKVIELDNTVADAYKKRGIYRQELKDWQESVRDFSAALKLNPGAFIINRIRGVSYFHMGRYAEAIMDYSAYLKKDSTNKEVVGYRGMAYLKANVRLKAYADFAVSYHHKLLDYKDMEHLVDSVLHEQDTTRAMYYLDRITTAAPYFTEGYVQKFKIHLSRNEWEPIEENIRAALINSRRDASNSSHSYLLTLMGITYSKNRHRDDAVKSLGEAIKFDPKNDFAYLERGRLFLSMGKRSKAEEDLKEASALGNSRAKELLANIH